MKTKIYPLVLVLISSMIATGCFLGEKTSTDDSVSISDSHVHIMSPALIAYWKELGIPFSRPEEYYSNVDTILFNNQAQSIDLIGMGYVYGNPEYYQGDDAEERLKAENDFILNATQSYKDKVNPYIAVDPLKDYAVSELERCYGLNPDIGLKLHFSTSQVYLTEPEHLKMVKPVFLKASALKTPVLLHFDNWHPKFGKPDLELFADSILSQIDPIEIRIAHFGTSGGFNQKTKDFIDAYLTLKTENRIPEKHKIYFDISAVALDKDSEGVPKLTEEAFTELRSYINRIGIDNIIFGSDYPLYNSIDYIEVLKNKVGLTEDEMRTIIDHADSASKN